MNTALVKAVANFFKIHFQFVYPNNLLPSLGKFLGKMNATAIKFNPIQFHHSRRTGIRRFLEKRVQIGLPIQILRHGK